MDRMKTILAVMREVDCQVSDPSANKRRHFFWNAAFQGKDAPISRALITFVTWNIAEFHS